MLRDSALADYLRSSPSNLAVLTDYAAMEVYKANSVEALRRSMGILSQYPNQVLILKGTQALCGINARAAGLQRRMVDEHQTRDFKHLCRLLPHVSDDQIRDQFNELAHSAAAQMDRMLVDAKTTAEAIEKIQEAYAATELLVIRRDEPYTEEMIRKLMTHVSELARNLIQRHPRARKFRKGAEEPRNNFLFRVALCAYLLALRWIAVGGAHSASPEKIRNDMVDVNFAACATYFDGLLSSDKKLLSICDEAIVWLDLIFVPVVSSARKKK